MTFCHLISQACSKQNPLHPEIQVPAVRQSALHPHKAAQMVLCSLLYNVSLFKSENNRGMERGMGMEDHEAYTTEGWSVLKHFDTTVWKVSTAVVGVE